MIKIMMVIILILMCSCYENFEEQKVFCIDRPNTCPNNDTIYQKCYAENCIDGNFCEEPYFIYYKYDDATYNKSIDMIFDMISAGEECD